LLAHHDDMVREHRSLERREVDVRQVSQIAGRDLGTEIDRRVARGNERTDREARGRPGRRMGMRRHSGPSIARRSFAERARSLLAKARRTCGVALSKYRLKLRRAMLGPL